MRHIALYREWRPQTFSEVVAQTQVVYPLKQSIINGEIGHAYLFSGTRGTGKTSTAKIFAKAVNCLQPKDGNPCNQCEICKAIDNGSLLDVMEIDAASNNSVDNIRRITDEIVFMPSQAKYKVYIIDEVHMLSGGAFNALLKTLEEPPAHAIFILATTEPHRIPATVLSRCLRFDFRRISHMEIIERLKTIAKKDEIEIEDSAISSIAQLADGALRDAISLLDQARSGIDAPITREKLFDMVGIVQDQFMLSLVSALLESNLKEVLDLVNTMVMSGRDLERFITEFAQFLRNLLVAKITADTDQWFGFSDEALSQVAELANQSSEVLLLQWIEEISKLSSDLKYSGDPRIAIEIALIKLLNRNNVKISSQKIPLPALQLDSSNSTAKDKNQTKVASHASFIEEAEENKAQALDQDLEINDKARTEKDIVTRDDVQEEETVSSSKLDSIDLYDTKDKDLDETSNTTGEKADTDTTTKKADNNESLDDNDGLENKPFEEQWQAALNYLAKQHRIDLKMLLSPAKVTYKDNKWEIKFDKKLRSHYETIVQTENKTLIKSALLSVTPNNKIELKIELVNKDEIIDDNLNPDEPVWIKEVRQMAQDLKIPIMMED